MPCQHLISLVQFRVCWLSPAANPSDVSSLCSLGFASLPGQTCSLTQLLTQLLRFDCAMCVTSCSRARGASCGVNEWNRALSPTSLRPADQEPPRLPAQLHRKKCSRGAARGFNRLSQRSRLQGMGRAERASMHIPASGAARGRAEKRQQKGHKRGVRGRESGCRGREHVSGSVLKWKGSGCDHGGSALVE